VVSLIGTNRRRQANFLPPYVLKRPPDNLKNQNLALECSTLILFVKKKIQYLVFF